LEKVVFNHIFIHLSFVYLFNHILILIIIIFIIIIIIIIYFYLFNYFEKRNT